MIFIVQYISSNILIHTAFFIIQTPKSFTNYMYSFKINTHSSFLINQLEIQSSRNYLKEAHLFIKNTLIKNALITYGPKNTRSAFFYTRPN